MVEVEEPDEVSGWSEIEGGGFFLNLDSAEVKMEAQKLGLSWEEFRGAWLKFRQGETLWQW